MLFLDGVYVVNKHGSVARFQWVKPPIGEELARLTLTIAKRTGRFLEREGLLERDAEHRYLSSNAVEDEYDPMHPAYRTTIMTAEISDGLEVRL